MRAVEGLPLPHVSEDDDVDIIAKRYFKLLIENGAPSVLIGWSFGGVIAFRIAQLVLEATGRAPPVVVIDMPAPAVKSMRSIDQVGDAEIVAAIISHWARETGRELQVSGWDGASTEDETLTALIDQLGSDLLTEGLNPGLCRRMAAGYRRRLAAIERFRPMPYSGQVILLVAREAEFGEAGPLRGVFSSPADDPTWGWQSLTSKSVMVSDVDAHHVTMLQKPAVKYVADVVRQWTGA